MIPELLLVFGLVLVNAMLSGSELALISLTEPQLARLEQQGGSARAAAELARDHNRLLATIQIGITLAGFMASAVAAVSLAEPLYSLFDVFGDAGETVAVIFVTVILSFITLVFGELVPKRLALRHPVGWATALGRVLWWLAVIATPVVWLLSVTTDFFVRIFGGRSTGPDESEQLNELRELVLMTEGLDHDQQDVLMGAFDVADRPVLGVMTPRLDVITIDALTPVADAIGEMTRAAFTRLPVVADDAGLDESAGIVTLQDLVTAPRTDVVGQHVRSVPAIPETMKVLPALRVLQSGRDQLAFVIDEFGGVEGIVTVEDLVEELVGEIYDDADALVLQPRAVGDGSYLVPGRYPVHDLVEMGLDVPEGDYATVAGLVLDTFEDLPSEGDEATVGPWTIVVRSVSGNTVERVLLRRADPDT